RRRRAHRRVPDERRREGDVRQVRRLGRGPAGRLPPDRAVAGLMAAPGPILETPRLILRPPVLEDLEGYVALMADAEHVRFIGGAAPRSTVWRQMMTVAGSWTLNGFSFFSVVEKSSGRWLGRLGPWRPDGWPGNEVGWSLLR